MNSLEDKIINAIKSYPSIENIDKVIDNINRILAEESMSNENLDVYKRILNCIDLTTLGVEDTEEKVLAMVEKVNEFEDNFPELPNVAAICVYPSLLSVLQDHLEVEDVEVAAVIGGFPASQTFIEVKIAETSLSLLHGATEGDMVISVGKFFSEQYSEVFDEIAEMKSACGEAHLKVILETGALKTPENIYKASIIAMEAGADFIKTSTGKIAQAATLDAAYVMCRAIKDFYDKSGRKVGFKAAGGIVDSEDAVKYYTLVKSILGDEWLCPELFRIGASRLANNMLSKIMGHEVNYF